MTSAGAQLAHDPRPERAQRSPAPPLVSTKVRAPARVGGHRERARLGALLDRGLEDSTLKGSAIVGRQTFKLEGAGRVRVGTGLSQRPLPAVARSVVATQLAISVRRAAPSLARTCSTWALTVLGATDSSAAISALVRPVAISRATWNSRAVSGCHDSASE